MVAIALWPSVLHAQSHDGTPTPELPTATPLPTAAVPPTTPIPTVVLQLTDILRTTAHVAVVERDAWALSAPTSSLFLSLAGIVLVIGLILFLVAQVRP
jgi:hypothetical protein